MSDRCWEDTTVTVPDRLVGSVPRSSVPQSTAEIEAAGSIPRPKTISEQAHDLLPDLVKLPFPVAEKILAEYGKACITRFKLDLIDFLSHQPERMLTTNNLVAMVRDLKPEWGV